MNDQELLEQFRELDQEYQQGIYTDIEMIAKSTELLGEGNAALWAAFPAEMRKKIEAEVLSFSEHEEFVYFGAQSYEAAKRRLLGLKQWLMSMKDP